MIRYDTAHFASTLPKPHEPTLKPTHCQRACKANIRREIVLKNCRPEKIQNAGTRATRKDRM